MEHDDVRALGTGEVTVTEVETAAAASAPSRPADVATGERAHTGKYRPLWEWLLQQERREIRISFSDLERQARITLPDSSEPIRRTGTATRAAPSCEPSSTPAGTLRGSTSTLA
ncbi:MAG: hypothetical protein M3P31_00030 [Actinomycetota bacterium]|nr:hypothetical protein [Actinomycetota bacterium]